MNLYYESDPADESTVPQLPPLLSAVALPSGQDVFSKAIAVASSSEAGTVFYSEEVDKAEFFVRLAPEVPLSIAGQMLFAMMIGLGDSIGALAPPEVAVSYQLPGYILLNWEGGNGAFAADPAASLDDVPDWLIVGAEVSIREKNPSSENWVLRNGVEYTNLAEEGGGFISRTRLIESCCRHFLVWVNRWQDDGFRPLFDSWSQRLDKSMQIEFLENKSVEWLGLDENGGTLVKIDGSPTVILPHELKTMWYTQFIEFVSKEIDEACAYNTI